MPKSPERPAAIECQLHSVALQTDNFERAFHFYTEILGLQVVRAPFDFKGKRTLTWLDAGSCLLELYSVKKGVEPQPWSERKLGPVNLALVVADLDAALEWLSLKGVHILRQPFVPPSGDPYQPRCAFVEGPDGEEILLREPADERSLVS